MPFINFNLAKITQNVVQKITPNKAGENNQNLFAETSKESSENELQDIVTFNAVAFKNNSISEEEIIDLTAQLDEAVENSNKQSKETIKNILLDSGLNSYDILSIMKTNPGKKDWLIKGIKKEFSGKEEDKLLKLISDACVEILTGNDTLAKEIADNYIKTMDDISKFISTVDNDFDSNIKTSTLIVGIRG